MQEYIKDAILTNDFQDLVLLRLVDLTVYSIQRETSLFRSILDEPAFYRKHFYLWVSEALEEKKTLAQMEQFDPFSD